MEFMELFYKYSNILKKLKILKNKILNTIQDEERAFCIIHYFVM